MPILLILLIAICVRSGSGWSDPFPADVEPCDSEVFCANGSGSLLHTVQMSGIFEDSKTFVDMPLRADPAQVRANFDLMMKVHGGHPAKSDVRKFVDSNFAPVASEFEDWIPPDWQRNPPLLDSIKDLNYRKFALALHDTWLKLGRKIRPEVAKDPDRYTLIYMDNPFVVPGGRFRECYYWDSYWTILGLMASGLHGTARGMLENLSGLVHKFGMIPNGNRWYYSKRSQPPLFVQMVQVYFQKTNDKELLTRVIDSMVREFDFWTNNRTIAVSGRGGRAFHLATYSSSVGIPRPEGYRQDYSFASDSYNTEESKLNYYRSVRAGAESGWDFSSKWFIRENGGVSDNMKDIDVANVVPVELNSYLCKNAKSLASMLRVLHRDTEAAQFEAKFVQIREAIEELLWNEDAGSWFDYDLKHSQPRDEFYPSNFAPLWADCVSPNSRSEKMAKVFEYVNSGGLFDYPGGLPTSLHNTNQQWDYRNAWPPLQEMVIQGFMNAGDAKLTRTAFELADKWVRNNYVAFVLSNGTMYEKYDAGKVGVPGSSGEYKVQDGFGWTNGVILHLLATYGSVLTYDAESGGAVNAAVTSPVVILGAVIAVLAVWLAVARSRKILRWWGLVKRRLYRPWNLQYSIVPSSGNGFP